MMKDELQETQQDSMRELRKGDVLSAALLYETLQSKLLGRVILFFPSIGSTNNLVKELALQGEGEGLLVVAEAQSAGQGRFGKSFYSPPGTGIYMSFFVAPQPSTRPATHLTLIAAVAVAEAIELLAGVEAKVKWVNDLLVRDRKVCGILVESILRAGSSEVIGAVVGIGINIGTTSFPPELAVVAGSVGCAEGRSYIRAEMIAEILRRYEHWLLQDDSNALLDSYRNRSAVLGQEIAYTLNNCLLTGRAVAIDTMGRLVVEESDGKTRTLDSGEVSIRRLADHFKNTP